MNRKGQEFLSFSRKISLQRLTGQSDPPHQTAEYERFLEFFPQLLDLFRQAREREPEEFVRTIDHTFRGLAIFNRISQQAFPESGLDQSALLPIYRLAKEIEGLSPLLIPYILWLHDLGKLEDKGHHTVKGAELIGELQLLDDSPLEGEIRLLITKVVQYHLLIGTLYSGETSPLSFRVLLDDPEFFPIWQDPLLRRLFIDALLLFTLIDVWAYPHNHRGITPTMIENYFQLKDRLWQVLGSGQGQEEVIARLRELAQQSTDWRLACYLRSFSQIGTKPFLTQDFYQKKVMDSATLYLGRKINPSEWARFKQRHLSRFPQVQFHYALGLLCLLSFREIERFRQAFDPTLQLNPLLFKLLTLLDDRLGLWEKVHGLPPDCLWEVYFVGLPRWSRRSDLLEKIHLPGVLEEILDEAQTQIDPGGIYNRLYLNFQPHWRYLV